MRNKSLWKKSKKWRKTCDRNRKEGKQKGQHFFKKLFETLNNNTVAAADYDGGDGEDKTIKYKNNEGRKGRKENTNKINQGLSQTKVNE